MEIVFYIELVTTLMSEPEYLSQSCDQRCKALTPYLLDHLFRGLWLHDCCGLSAEAAVALYRPYLTLKS